MLLGRLLAGDCPPTLSESNPVSTSDVSSAVATGVLETTLVAVTVYPEQARVTRRGQVQVMAGQTRLVVDALPKTLQLQTVQTHQCSGVDIQLQGVEVIPTAMVADRSPGTIASSDASTNALSDRLQELEQRFRQVKDKLAALTLQRDFLTKLATRTAHTFSLGLARQQVDLAAVTALLTYVETQHIRLGEAIAQQERLKQELDHLLQGVRHQLQEAQATPPETRYQIHIPLTANQTGAVELEISYCVSDAAWEPAYDVRFGGAPDRLQLSYLARVHQTTGEDWEQVSLKLSTAAPERSPMLPQPDAWYVTLPAADRAKVGPQGRSRSPMLQDTYRMLGALPGSEIPPQIVEAKPPTQFHAAAIAVVSFDVPQRVTIPSNGSRQRVALSQADFPSQFTYVALPQRCDAPYLQAHLTNPQDGVPLLPGTAHLFRDGGYIGQEQFDYVAPGQSFQLSLGLDERLQVQRELVQRQTAQGQDHCSIALSYRLSIHNPLNHAVQMQVMEQIPISRSDQIIIDLQSANPAITQHQSGLCQWMLTLAATATQQVQYHYTLTHPCEATVLGLDV
jgi:uncharacterized protein (TIGR02231 family)